MQAIMERLTAKAYNEYDGAARAHIVARLLQEAVAVPPGSTPSESSSVVCVLTCIDTHMAQTMWLCMQVCVMSEMTKGLSVAWAAAECCFCAIWQHSG